MADVVYALGFRTWADGMKVGYAFSPERIAVQIRDDPSVEWFLLVDPYRSWISRARRRSPAPVFSTDPTRRLEHPYRLSRVEPMTIEGAVHAYRRLDRHLRSLTVGRDAVLVTSQPVLAAVADKAVWRDVAYYAWDDFRGVPGARQVVQWSYEAMAVRGVNVVGVAQAIVEAIGSARSTVVPNGIAASDYEALPSPPDWFTDLTGRVAFYAGSLQARIDVHALVHLARDLGEGWTVVLVGPLQDAEALQPLMAEPRVQVRPAEPRERVLAMMRDADVCLVPHLPETEFMSPLKVYEYLGAGTPVVATDVQPVRGLSPRCLLVPPGQALAPAVLRACELGPAPAAELTDFRALHDWTARYRVWRRAVLGY